MSMEGQDYIYICRYIYIIHVCMLNLESICACLLRDKIFKINSVIYEALGPYYYCTVNTEEHYLVLSSARALKFKLLILSTVEIYHI